MNKERNEYLNWKKKTREWTFADDYIKELEKETKYLRLLLDGINKHSSFIEQITGQDLDIFFGKIK